jgi:hypothetical protein
MIHGYVTTTSSSAYFHLDVTAMRSSEKKSKMALTPPAEPLLHSTEGLISDPHLTFMLLTKGTA